MGQQQLLLLVLATVIVGIAIVVGINAYSENSVRTSWDSLLQDAMRIANDAQSWKNKPEMFGGSSDLTKTDENDFDGVNFIDLAYSGGAISGGSNQCYTNLNGVFELTSSTDDLTIDGYSVTNQNKVQVDVTGTTEDKVALDRTESIRGGKDFSGTDDPVTAPACA